MTTIFLTVMCILNIGNKYKKGTAKYFRKEIYEKHNQ